MAEILAKERWRLIGLKYHNVGTTNNYMKQITTLHALS